MLSLLYPFGTRNQLPKVTRNSKPVDYICTSSLGTVQNTGGICLILFGSAF